MKFQKLLTFHRQLANKMGDDLVYSLSFDAGKVYVVISTHKSKTRRYKNGKKIQTCQIKNEDFERDVQELVNEIKSLYDNLLEDGINEIATII